jgi:Mrp family chromosome partitioning ATPase
MARILEALKQAETRRGRPVTAVAAPRPYRPDAEPTTDVEDETIPFIEVGAPRTPAPRQVGIDAALPVERVGLQPPWENGVPASPPQPLLQVTFQPVHAEPIVPGPERFAADVIAFHRPEHPVSEQYHRVVADMRVRLPAEQPHVLLFTSAVPRAGTTTVLLNLAVSYAREGHANVVLVDANLRRPAVAERLGLPTAPGLQDVLSGTIALPQALRETGQAKLHALTAGKALDGGSSLLAGEAMRAVLRHLRGRFHWVLVDAPCWAGRPEVVALGAACDAVYLVLPQLHAKSPEVEGVVHAMPRQGNRLRGCIFTEPYDG